MHEKPSSPPKERVNIVYRAGTDGQSQEQELPLKLLVMGDYTQRTDDTPIGERRAVRIDGDNFDAVMRESALSLDITVPKTLGRKQTDGASTLPAEVIDIHLDVASLQDLTPEGICAQVPALEQLLRLRQALVALKGPLGNVPAFRKGLQALLLDDNARARLTQELGLDADGT